MTQRPSVYAVIAMAGLALAQAAPASAHHSYAAFDRSKTLTLTGTVKEWEWTNPHTWLTITTADPTRKAATQTWALEGMAPGTLRARGWSRLSVKPGDKVSITINPRRDGSTGGTLVSLTLPDGKVLGGPGS